MPCRALLLTWLLIWSAPTLLSPVAAAVRTFPAGSVVIPADPCWQPVAVLPVRSGCAAGGSLAGAAGVYGLAYRLQRAGVPVYQTDLRGLAELPAGLSLVIRGDAAAPVVSHPGGVPLDPPAHLMDYWAPPFLVDAGDLDLSAAALLADNPYVRRHHALLPFSAPVTRVLTGLPTRIVAADRAAVDALAATLSLAGLDGTAGLTVVPAELTSPPVTDTALSSCSGEALPFAPLQGSCGLPTLFADLAAVPTTTVPREAVMTAPVGDDGVLYVASFAFPGPAGHLRAFALDGGRQTLLWDAVERIPLPGTGLSSPPAAELDLSPPFNGQTEERLVFTNLGAAEGFRPVNFTAAAAPLLQPFLGLDSTAAAAALINAVRGRTATSEATPAGSGDRPVRLGAISRSSPALVGASPVSAAAAERDLVVYAGAEDGMLHAFLAGRREPAGGYNHTGEGCGTELWGYLPGSLLPALKLQSFGDPGGLATVHVEGIPLVTDLFIDFDGDGRSEWRTVLVGTASDYSSNRGTVFAIDVTDPYVPQLLWETALPGSGLGRSRGAAIGTAGGGAAASPRVFVTAGTAGRITAQGVPDPIGGSYGVMACALDLINGRLLWRFVVPYPGDVANLAEPPTAPALMAAATGNGIDGIVFGDLAGRLWVLDPDSGAPVGGRPVWQSPGGSDEPIGGGLALRNRLVLLATGGVPHASVERNYSVYAVEVLPETARLLWTLPLLPGEKLWGAPTFDRFGRAYLGLGRSADSGGRLLVVAADGMLAGSAALEGSPGGGLTLVSGAVVSVSGTGQVELFGEPGHEPQSQQVAPGQVRIFSWRMR